VAAQTPIRVRDEKPNRFMMCSTWVLTLVLAGNRRAAISLFVSPDVTNVAISRSRWNRISTRGWEGSSRFRTIMSLMVPSDSASGVARMV